MLKKFVVSNYKNFKGDFTIDFSNVGGYKFNQDCITNNLLGKVIIYGRNATGKTNLGNAIGDITTIISGVRVRYINESILNANSQGENIKFCYEFIFNESNILYQYEKNCNNELLKETLFIDEECVYELDFNNGDFSRIDLDKIEAGTIQVERYLESIKNDDLEMEIEERSKVPFLRFILNNSALMQDSVLRRMEDYVLRMKFYSVKNQMSMSVPRINVSFVEYLTEDNNLYDFEEFLNVMGVDCKLKIFNGSDGDKRLCFDYDNPVPFFETASSGTISLMNFYKSYVISRRMPSFIYMDEFDAFYHYEMAEKLVKYFKLKFIDCQVVMTTHNTNLMTNYLMRPDCVMILSRDGRLTALCDATERELREGHNLEKLYIGGEFEKYE